ncbi:type B 50S ribosomal protein L31 [Streptomyces sp. NPDC096105]|uniref:type B 50S ribosomal protein L31 n=1 Tax=Streptomyces sp. NPDC096105 TaxID=3366074 RepID=UPI0038156FB8
MRHGTRPASRPAVFRDRAAGFPFLTRSTLDSGRTVEWEDGTTCPVADVEIPSASHPFRTGTARVLHTAGRVERFERRSGTAPARR